MRFARSNFTGDYGLAAHGVVFDPAMLTVATMAATAAGGAMSAAGTLAGGSYAKTAGEMQQQVAQQQAAQAIASGQRKMFDTQLRTRTAQSTLATRAGASGVDTSTGSPVATTGAVAQRGSYQALIDMFNGESNASGLRYSGDVAEWEGEQKKSASDLAAAGTIASTAGSMFSQYGKFQYPTTRGSAGTSL